MVESLSLHNQTAVITGTTAGIGFASALALAKNGARVIGVGRHPQRCAEAERLLRSASPSGQVRCLTADLSLQRQVRDLAVAIRSQLAEWGAEGLEILVNNAGTYSQSYRKTTEGIELTLAVNHLAPFLLTHELQPQLMAARGARVITVSSDSHYRTWLDPRRLNRPLLYLGLWAYKESKLANVLFTVEFNRRYAQFGLRAFAVDPGLVRTDIGLKGQPAFSRFIWRLRQRAGVEPETPARTILYLSSQPGFATTSAVYWYNCQPKQPSPQAINANTARELWQVSCALCGIQDQEER
jgi:NAD(P)-dependent dehydrogenase (short-subunit alcohol dehydrogenase family)